MKEKERRDFLKWAGVGIAGAMAISAPAMGQSSEQNGGQAGAGAGSDSGRVFEVMQFGAKGDGDTIDGPAINRAIEAAAAHGGGTVHLSAGQYLSYSIRLKSNVALHIDQGAVIIAADAMREGHAGGYDEPEPVEPWEAFQDYAHNHWHNSLIWGEDLHDIAVRGPGRIWGRGLSRDNGPGSEDAKDRRTNGVGNKSVSLKNCHNVLLQSFQILQGGWIGVLATGVDNLVIEDVTIDTNRDGMDIDCCRNVRIANCAVNSPWDDAIVLKSSYGLGYARATENVTISNCFVTGTYEIGSLLDGTWKKFPESVTVWRTGRIKLGTESNGGFSNIAISNCVFEGCQGLALESVDGAVLENVTITNIAMRDIYSAPIFMRLGSRLRGPAGSKTGKLRRILVSNIVCSDVISQLGCIVSGVPGHDIDDVKLQNIYIQHRGGGTNEEAAIVPPENAAKYPEPNMFGPMPSQGFYVRHVKSIELSGVEIIATQNDARPAFVLSNVDGADLFHIKTPIGAPVMEVRESTNVMALWVRGVKDGAVLSSGS